MKTSMQFADSHFNIGYLKTSNADASNCNASTRICIRGPLDIKWMVGDLAYPTSRSHCSKTRLRLLLITCLAIEASLGPTDSTSKGKGIGVAVKPSPRFSEQCRLWIKETVYQIIQFGI